MDSARIALESQPPQRPTAREQEASRPARAQTPPPADDSRRETESDRPVERGELDRAARELEHRFEMKVVVAHDEKTGRDVVRIFSQDGERLLRQMPPDKVLEMAAQARQGTLESLLSSKV